jgi:hypothetical protein
MFAVFALLSVLARRAFRTVSIIYLLIGTLLLAAAIGRPAFLRSAPARVAVMVDLSPSTRGATFRDSAALDRRLGQLLGDQPYQLLGFSDHNQPIDLKSPMRDLPCDATRFDPPPVDAIVLFSDGRFDLPASAPPTFPVIDPALDQPGDAAVSHLQIVGSRVTVTISHAASAVQWHGATADSGTASSTTSSATVSGPGEIIASIPATDLWPENDSLSIIPPPPLLRERWWIGGACPAGWIAKRQLPSDATAYLSTSAIVLNNIAADDLSSDQQLRLGQYVRDLGGSLVIVGGDRAFAAGGYGGSALETMSPLSSNPPRPLLRWLIVADSSGSMAGDAWKNERGVIRSLLPKLPANDLVSVGDFARDLRWWWHDAAAQTLAMRDPPAVNPTGPTNLSAMLTQLTEASDGASPGVLLLMTDADAELPDAAGISDRLSRKKIALNLLALGNGSALPALRAMAQHTGGQVLEQSDPGQWITSANQLLRSALPARYQHRPVDLSPGPGHVTAWNQTWEKTQSQVLQRAGDVPMVARWHAGLGQVLAIAYPADSASIDALAQQIAQPTVDPRFDVKWEAGEKLGVTIHAMDHAQYLNGESLSIELRDAESCVVSTASPIAQSAPGQYTIVLPAPRTPQLVTVRHGDQIFRQFAVAGRYAPEFDAIGNDRANLEMLAVRSGGKVIPAGPVQPLNLRGRISLMDLTSEFAIAGFAAISAGLLVNRRK